MSKNKTVLVTGGSRGIGLAICEEFKRAGYKVIAPTRQELDLNSLDSIKNFVAKPKNQKIDILINNAGINKPEWIAEMQDETIDETIQVNLTAPFYLIRACVPYMKQQKWGRIINVSSIFGIVARAKQTLYCATKHGLNGLTKSLALELAQDNILVNSVCPGFTKTQLVLRNPPEKIKAIENDIPLGRLAEPGEIAKAVFYLASPENTYLTGQTIIIDGGFSCK